MSVLIVYSSFSGTTGEIARSLAGLLEAKGVSTVVADAADRPSPSEHQAVILGGAIHAGSVSSKFKRYCLRHEAELLERKLGIFISAIAAEEHSKAYLESNVPPRLVAHSSINIFPGGRVRLSQLKPLSRFIMKHMAHITEDMDTIDKRTIEQMAAYFSDLH